MRAGDILSAEELIKIIRVGRQVPGRMNVFYKEEVVDMSERDVRHPVYKINKVYHPDDIKWIEVQEVSGSFQQRKIEVE